MQARILITGTSTGIGAATAREMAPGNTLCLHYNSSEREADQLHQLTDGLELLVNNAGGVVQRESIEEIEWETIEEIFTLNAFSTFMVTKLVLSLLRAGHHLQIINMTSVAMRTGSPSAVMYAASKGAVDTFTRGIAKSLAPHIRVNSIAPGLIVTPFHEKYTSEEQLEQFRAQTPLQRFAEPAEIARAVRYLYDSTFLTGATIDVNGGMYMR